MSSIYVQLNSVLKITAQSPGTHNRAWLDNETPFRDLLSIEPD
jgi:hypothetical protein